MYSLVVVFPQNKQVSLVEEKLRQKLFVSALINYEIPQQNNKEKNWIQMNNKYVINHFDDKFSINTLSNIKDYKERIWHIVMSLLAHTFFKTL